MTDFERVKALFTSLGYTERPKTDNYHHGLKADEFYIDSSDNGYTTINFGDGGRKHGYRDFGFCLAFREDGSFDGHGAFE